MKTLRPYQKEAKQSTFKKVKAHARAKELTKSVVLGLLIRVLIVMATGLGKTVVAAQVARTWRRQYKTRILFMMHMTDAVVQARKEFVNALTSTTSTGLITGDERENLDADVIFTTFQSMAGMLDYYKPDDFGFVIIDEAHHGHAETYKVVIDHFQPDMLYGMTATPNRMDGLDIRNIFDEPTYEYNLAEALADGRWLAEVDYRMMVDNISKQKLGALLQRVKKGDRKVTMQDINRTVFLRERIDAEVRIIKREQRTNNKQTIIFCKTINHVKEVVRRFPKGKALGYHRKLNRKALKGRLAAFQSGELQTMVVVDKFNEAMDIPSAELIVFLRSTNSNTVWLQQLGRGLRRTNNKTKVVVLDFVANCQRLQDTQEFNIKIKGSEGESYSSEIKTGWSISHTKELVDVLELLKLLKRDLYNTWEEASATTQAMGINTQDEYNERFKEDLYLPSKPDGKYKDVWKENGGWYGFLGKELRRRRHYKAYEECSQAARALNASTRDEYHLSYSQDSRLPRNPKREFAKVWDKHGGWKGFLGLRVVGNRYTYAEASAAVQTLGINSKREYADRHKEDQRLPTCPNKVYSAEWTNKGGWPGFFCRKNIHRRSGDVFPTFEEASTVARALGFTKIRDYTKEYKKNPRLPSAPYYTYRDVWKKNGGWSGFLGTKERRAQKVWS